MCFYIRPHHLIRLLSFKGKGYDEAFVEGMQKVATNLQTNRDKKQILISEGCDDICKHCSKKHGNRCEEEENILRLDRIFSKVLGVKKREILSLSDVEEKKKSMNFDKFQRICGHCCWFKICRETLFLEHKEI